MHALTKECKSLIDNGQITEARLMLDRMNQAFYEGEPLIPDLEFDDLAKLLSTLTPTQTGERLSDQAVTPHNYPLLATWLSKCTTVADAIAWMKRLSAGSSLFDSVASLKGDGMSIVIEFADMRVQRAITRGENGRGVDCTAFFQNTPSIIQTNLPYGLKAEVMMSREDMLRLKDDRGITLANMRNGAAGLVRRNDPELFEYVTLAPIDYQFKSEKANPSRIDRLQTLCDSFDAWNCQKIWLEFQPVFHEGENTVEEAIENTFQRFSTARKELEESFMFDGVVIELTSQEDIQRLGSRSVEPLFITALKFDSMVGRSKVLKMEWDHGATGRLTPCVVYEPVEIDGRVFSRTSISNMRRFDELRLAEGTPIIIEIRGDVLAWITRDGPDPEGSVPFEVSPRVNRFSLNDAGERVFAYTDEPVIAKRIERLLDKCGVRGIKFDTIQPLVDAGLITEETGLTDIWSLDPEQIKVLHGFGEESASKITKILADKMAAGFLEHEILAGVGIESVGRTLALMVLEHVPLKVLVNEQTDEVVSRVKSVVGEVRADVICQGALKYANEINRLCDLLKPRQNTPVAPTSGPQLKLVITGELKHWPVRNDFERLVESMGHKVVNSVSRKTDYLITNDKNSGTGKNAKAAALGIPVLSESEAIAKLGIQLSQVPNAALEKALVGTAVAVAVDTFEDL